MGKYEELSLRQQQTELLQQQSIDAESIRLMDRQAYDELTHDSGAHDQLLSDLEQQLEHLCEIRETGRPAQLTPVQQESGRYENIGHFDKKARKKAAKEAASLTQKARKLQNSLQNKPDGAPTVFEDIQMTKYMEQAELESLKANGYKEQNPRYLRTRLKYLRHAEIILESALSDAQMTDQQTQTLISTYQNVQQKIDAILQVQGLQELSDNSYRSEVDRQLQQPELSPEEADALMRQSMKLLKRDDIDLLSAKLFSPKLVRVNEQQAQDFLQQNQMETQQTQHAATQQENQLQILSHPKSEDFPEEINEDTQLIDELLAEIVQYKDELGGSPHFGDELPTYRSNKETFFGYPVEAFEAFCRNHIENAGNFFTRGFFKMLAKMGPVQTESLQQTKYEEVCLHLQSMKALAQKKTVLTQMFTEANAYANHSNVSEACGMFFMDISRIACHAKENSPAGVLAAINTYFDMLRTQFPHEKSSNTLKDFFSELYGVCFEDRTSRLQEYCAAHPIEETHMQDLPQEGLFVRDLSNVPDINPSLGYASVVAQWVGAIRSSNHLETQELTIEDILPCLLYEMNGKTYPDIDDDGNPLEGSVTITEELLRSDKLWSVLCDIYCVLP